MDELAVALAQHRTDPFPSEIEKGRDYGRVDPVMIGSDIYGWALAASRGRLDGDGTARLARARADLAASLTTIPNSAVGYYESLIRLADLALVTASDDA